ncbi:MAG: hypothetical protein M3O22_04825 [Pseudomonadota bacterium]|nr:hypothetical protein [Pseudomonadota bacterium]
MTPLQTFLDSYIQDLPHTRCDRILRTQDGRILGVMFQDDTGRKTKQSHASQAVFICLSPEGPGISGELNCPVRSQAQGQLLPDDASFLKTTGLLAGMTGVDQFRLVEILAIAEKEWRDALDALCRAGTLTTGQAISIVPVKIPREVRYAPAARP